MLEQHQGFLDSPNNSVIFSDSFVSADAGIPAVYQVQTDQTRSSQHSCKKEQDGRLVLVLHARPER